MPVRPAAAALFAGHQRCRGRRSIEGLALGLDRVLASGPQDAASRMPYGDYTDLTARQRVAALKALLNLVLSAEDVHERIAQRAEAYHSQRRTAKDAPPAAAAPAAGPDGQPAPPPAPVAPPRGARGRLSS